ncbi:hypothetical protein V8B97DRAFT_2005828 [Scleroderma yunnanense]
MRPTFVFSFFVLVVVHMAGAMPQPGPAAADDMVKRVDAAAADDNMVKRADAAVADGDMVKRADAAAADGLEGLGDLLGLLGGLGL